MRGMRRAAVALFAAAGITGGLVIGAASASASDHHRHHGHHSRKPFISAFSTVKQGPSTIPTNGDENPYGVVVVKHSVGLLHRGDVLVSNFNNNMNQQGLGSTIVEVSPTGSVTQFAQISASSVPGCIGGVGLTTALVVLHGGWVVVGSLPTSNGMSATAQAGCLIVLDSNGNVAETFQNNGINGPWDMTAVSNRHFAELFVTNVLNGTVAASPDPANPNIVDEGTVLRLNLRISRHEPPRLLRVTEIGSGFPERTDQAALVIGPTGVGLGRNGTLYVADTLNNRIAAIRNATFRHSSAGIGMTVSSGGSLNGPLGLVIAPNGDILSVNSLDGNLVETTPRGKQVATFALDTTPTPPGLPGNGSLFGLAVAPHHDGIYFVDDDENQLNLFH
jgi:hypothetical protein